MTQTLESPDYPIDHMPVSARTRRTLDRAGITTMGALEQALLADDAIPGVGPKSLDDIDQALDKMDGTAEAEKSRVAAVRTILAEHDRLAEALMATVDLLVENPRLNGPNLRKASAAMMRGSLQATYSALQVLAPELPDRDEVPA